MILTFYSDKGGCGRSLLTRELGLFLQRQKKDTLLVDMDYKCSVSNSFGVECKERTILTLLEKKSAPEVIQSTQWIDLIAGSRAIRNFSDEINLQELLQSVENIYPYILVDTAALPNPEQLLSSSHVVIIPLWIDAFSKEALKDTLEEILQRIPPERVFALYMGVDESETSMELVEELEKILEQHHVASFDTAIRYDETVREILYKGREMRSYVPVSDAAEDLEQLAMEIIEKTYVESKE